ncbi:DUF3087 family protein [Colwelliaceae bacterium 6441]
MNIIEIDKAKYRHRLNRVIVGFIAILAILSIIFGSVLIAIFAEQSIAVSTVLSENEPSSNFKYNFIGVIFALLACAALLNRLKTQTYFYEIYYVWRLKQLHNLIYRKLTKIKSAAFDANDIDAMIVLNFYYKSLKQVYLLDDNTLTISKVNNEEQKLVELLTNKNIIITTEQFSKEMLSSF